MAGNININMRVGGGCGCDSGGGSGGSGGGGGGSAGTFPIVDTLAGNEADKAPSVRAVNAGLATKATLGDDGKLPEDVLPITVIGNAFYRGAFMDGAALAAAHPDDVSGAYATVLSTNTFWIWDGAGWSDTGTTPPDRIAVIDNLTSTSATDALSANQGRVLDEKKADKTELANEVANIRNLIQNISTGGVGWEEMMEAINEAFLVRGLTGTLLNLLRTLYPMDGDDGKVLTVRANSNGTFRLVLMSIEELTGGGGGGNLVDPSTLSPVVLTTPGTHNWVVPEGIKSIYVTMCGAGGDGAAVNDGTLHYHGGGGAAIFRQLVGITENMWNTNIPITVGATPGGASSVGNILACEGGGTGSGSAGYGAGGNPGGYSGDDSRYPSLNILYTSVPQITIGGVRLGTTYQNTVYGRGWNGNNAPTGGLVIIEYSI